MVNRGVLMFCIYSHFSLASVNSNLHVLTAYILVELIETKGIRDLNNPQSFGLKNIQSVYLTYHFPKRDFFKVNGA